jgi:outer membrane immunogenic protein
MMKKILLATVALAALGMVPAGAADLAARTYTKAPMLAPAPTWAGFYLGAVGGYASEDSNSYGLERKGGSVGGTAGYNWQQGNVVFGLETDALWANVSQSAYGEEIKIDAMGTVRGRLGYATGAALLYVTGGYAWADSKLSAVGYNSSSQIHNGWTVGAGAEYMIAPQWSVKGEYLYKSFSSADYAGYSDAFPGTDFHTVQVGVNYHF